MSECDAELQRELRDTLSSSAHSLRVTGSGFPLIEVWMRIARAEIDESQLRIDGLRLPDARSAFRVRIREPKAGGQSRGDDAEAPQDKTLQGIVHRLHAASRAIAP